MAKFPVLFPRNNTINYEIETQLRGIGHANAQTQTINKTANIFIIIKQF